MINKPFYNFFSINVFISNFSYCISLNRKDNTVLLKNPQIVYHVNPDKYSINSPSILLTSEFLSIDNKQITQNVSTPIKFDKRNKNNIIVNDDAINKKGKLASKKKKRNKITLDTDDFFIKDTNLVKDVKVQDLNLSLVKPAKGKKQKKKEKISKEALGHDINITNQTNDPTSSVSYSNINKQVINKKIAINTPLTVKQLATQLNVSEASIITWLFLQGISVTINNLIDVSVATKVAHHYGFLVLNSINPPVLNHSFNYHNLKSTVDLDNNHNIIRAPIVTVFGHVDHGKTTFLDYIAQTNSVTKEIGGITQSITGYEIQHMYMSSERKLIFLDTPGHEAFASMRMRGAEVTDLAILIVAADDGVKPQTIEAINYILQRNIPYIVAINKIDKDGVDLNKIKGQLAKYGILDDKFQWELNKSNVCTSISALTGYNIDVLLDNICKLSESLNLKTNLDNNAEGIIIEAYLNKKVGAIATVVLKNGTLNLGDTIVAGNTYGKVKTIQNSNGIKISTAYSSAVIQISGFSDVPQTGLRFCIVKNEKAAKNLVMQYLTNDSESVKLLNSRVTWEAYNNINLKKVNLILKADTQGSMEAIIHAFSQIPQNKVQINIISYGSGSIYENDLDLAITSQSIILGFNIQILSSIQSLAEKLKIVIKNFNVIYDLLDYIKSHMLSLIPKQYEKLLIGGAVVQTVFYMNKGAVAGCLVTSGIIKQNGYIIVYRDNQVVYEGFLTSLKHLKNNVNEVLQGNECGVLCSGYNLWQKFDKIEVFDMIEKNNVL